MSYLSSPPPGRERWLLQAAGAPRIALQVQRAPRAAARDVLYVHGATFGADLSLYFPLDGCSWADALTQAGWNAWGFDFVGFGASARYPWELPQPAGCIEQALQDLQRAVAGVRERNGGRPLALLAHSRGGAVAARYAGEHADHVQALVLFAPIVLRPQVRPCRPGLDAAPMVARACRTDSGTAPASHYPLSAWAQYRRFVEDVPRGQAQVLAEAHMHAWAEQFLASDAGSAGRRPPAVLTPSGPAADIAALWSGHALYDPARIAAPTLLVRGEWDSLCTDADADRLLSALGARLRRDVKIPRATHLMHLEQQRQALYAAVNRFLEEVLA